MSSTIVVPLDGSALAERALPVAERLARAAKGRLILLRAADPLLTLGTDVLDGEHHALAQASQYLERIAAGLDATGLAIETQAACGRAAEHVLHEVGSREASLIVMATHGRGGLARLVLGSVATGAVQRAPMPLLLVRPGIVQTPVPGRAAEPPITAARREG